MSQFSGCSAPDEALAVQMAKHHRHLEIKIGAMMEEQQKSILEGIERMLQEQYFGRVGSTPRTVIQQRPKMSEVSVRHSVSKRTSTSTAKGIVSVGEAKRNFGTVKTMIIQGDRSASRSLGEAGDRAAWPFAVASTIKDRREFEIVVAVMILANAVSVGYHADWSIRNPGVDRAGSSRIIDWSFLCAFVLELAIRALAERWAFFDTANACFGWNVFDTCIVLIGILTEVDAFSLNLSMMRAVRVLRLVKVMRIFRFLTFFRELRVMVHGIVNCGRTLCWSLLLLLAITYIYAVFCLQVFADWLGSVDGAAAQSDIRIQNTIEMLHFHFSSLPWSLYTLFKAMSGGSSWGDVMADPMYHVGVIMVPSFALYISVTVFCVLNVIQGLHLSRHLRDKRSMTTRISWSTWTERRSGSKGWWPSSTSTTWRALAASASPSSRMWRRTGEPGRSSRRSDSTSISGAPGSS
ncbi:unnamed protein product [Prorocentrum cordatum]|uniref:Ion transport domain-containing protein n=1 Tax=Prorocentrum cordatum TaxID=2364126 RepID=A0ABN9W055_9DINO|nr:unnamed protein product [Polarella glacialis]